MREEEGSRTDVLVEEVVCVSDNFYCSLIRFLWDQVKPSFFGGGLDQNLLLLLFVPQLTDCLSIFLCVFCYLLSWGIFSAIHTYTRREKERAP